MTHAPATPSLDPAVYRTLVESTRAIPWAIDWDSKRFEYIGPQIESLLGWTPDSWATVHDWADRMHEDDRQRVFEFCVAQSLAGVDHEADYRALRADGGYVWIRDVVHVARDADGNVVRLVGFMFDITERKRSEEQLAELQRTLEALSYQDGLTGVANRRRVDAALDALWRGTGTHGHVLSVVLFDIDGFKAFNDRYGHLQGDDALQRVAQVLEARVADCGVPGALLGRFGGEEFIAVLPGCDEACAVRVAAACRVAVEALAIPHAGLPGGVLTLSAGSAQVDEGDARPAELVSRADRALYRAKQGGRNRVAHDTGA